MESVSGFRLSKNVKPNLTKQIALSAAVVYL